MKTPDSIKKYILTIIHKEGNIEPLHELGYEYSQIASFIQSEIDDKNAEYEQGLLKLSEQGLSILNELKKVETGFGIWIEPEIESKLKEKIDKTFVYLPKQSDIWLE